MHADKETIRPYLTAFLGVLSMSRMLIPADKISPQVTHLIDRLSEVANSPWFTDLLVYLVNTFGERADVSQEELGVALQQFGGTVKAGMNPPVSFQDQE